MAQGLIAIVDRWIPCDHGTPGPAGGARSKWAESGATWRLGVRMLRLVHGWPGDHPLPFGKQTYLWKMAMYSGFSHATW